MKRKFDKLHTGHILSRYKTSQSNGLIILFKYTKNIHIDFIKSYIKIIPSTFSIIICTTSILKTCSKASSIRH